MRKKQNFDILGLKVTFSFRFPSSTLLSLFLSRFFPFAGHLISFISVAKRYIYPPGLLDEIVLILVQFERSLHSAAFVPLRRLPMPSRSMHFNDVSERNGPRGPKRIGRAR